MNNYLEIFSSWQQLHPRQFLKKPAEHPAKRLEMRPKALTLPEDAVVLRRFTAQSVDERCDCFDC